MPDITLPLKPGQYDLIRKALLSSPEVLTHVESSPDAGQFATRQVALSYSYAPAGGTLAITILARYGIARFASTDVIRTRLVALLGTA